MSESPVAHIAITPLRGGSRDLKANAALPPEPANEEQRTILVKQKRQQRLLALPL